MKIVHHKTLWIHIVFSALMCLAIGSIVLVSRDLPSIILACLILIYVFGNGYIHYRRDDFQIETLYEYLLVGLAVFVIMTSAISH